MLSCGQSGKETSNEKVIQSKENRVALEFICNGEAAKETLLNQFEETTLECYSWKNHVVLFGNAVDTLGIDKLIHKTDFEVDIKRYNSPMYTFDKESHCKDSLIQKNWKNYLLTANLVEDTVLQQEYVDYHKKQFEEWPEVAQGFCNANFQQLLVFRNGRQLLLVISVPANKTLDELNPLTVKDNPSMEEWNSIMSKYQEGVEGTEPGETWVFLTKVEQD